MILNAMAQAHYDQQEHAEAEKLLLQSVAEQPAQVHGHRLLADILLLSQRHQQAIVSLRTLLAVEQSRLHTDVSPEPAVLFLKLGMCELLCHEPQKAIEHLSHALALGALDQEERTTAERYRGMAERMLAKR
jgi:tetratricopeptide (TPR) repeat protein